MTQVAGLDLAGVIAAGVQFGDARRGRYRSRWSARRHARKQLRPAGRHSRDRSPQCFARAFPASCHPLAPLILKPGRPQNGPGGDRGRGRYGRFAQWTGRKANAISHPGTKGDCAATGGQDIVNCHRGQDAPSVRGRMAALDLAIGDRIGVCPIHGTASCKLELRWRPRAVVVCGGRERRIDHGAAAAPAPPSARPRQCPLVPREGHSRKAEASPSSPPPSPLPWGSCWRPGASRAHRNISSRLGARRRCVDGRRRGRGGYQSACHRAAVSAAGARGRHRDRRAAARSAHRGVVAMGELSGCCCSSALCGSSISSTSWTGSTG